MSFDEYLNINKEVLHRPPIYFETKKEEEGGEQNASIEITMQYNDGYSENIFTFANMRRKA